ncbi:hypothetical protein C8F04DRAFT_1063984 [Mycena alexandri]|uniref:intramembrane prenyl-peptidase Rce1 n=1 Tax=Mycena alexandri TaxID=1745969 RepID=A0AAD6XII6_9AGAR|nr:hypothetical protein C8F04DRAFT_1063984 [Mycena alexandri]
MPPIQSPQYPLSMLSSHLLALSFSASYVGSLYVVKNARLRFSETPDARRNVQPGSRDDPAVIRARLAAATFASILCCWGVYTVVAQSSHPSFNYVLPRTLEILGVRWPDSIFSCLQTPLLFLGPLYASFLAGNLPGQSGYSINRDFKDVFFTWVGFRNYVWGPFTEEVVFRACVLAVYAMSGAARWKMIAFAPLVFGLAHAHHAWDTYNRYGRTRDALKRAVMATLFQTAYTTLFGAHTSYLFLRTSSLLPPLTAHVFCNIMGLPQIQYEMRRFPSQKQVILAVYLLGIALFAYTLKPWTAGQSIYWSIPDVFWRTVVGSTPR